VTNEIGYELDTNSKITFKELFSKLEEDIAEMDKRNLEIQTATNERNRDVSAPAVEYVKASQVLARSILDYNRKLLARDGASNWVDRKLEAYKAAVGSYSSEYERKATDKAIEDLKKANTEFLDTIPGILESAKALKASREAVAKIFPNDSLVPQDKLNELIKKLSPEDKGAKSTQKK
jgi:hypothetical protein